MYIKGRPKISLRQKTFNGSYGCYQRTFIRRNSRKNWTKISTRKPLNVISQSSPHTKVCLWHPKLPFRSWTPKFSDNGKFWDTLHLELTGIIVVKRFERNVRFFAGLGTHFHVFPDILVVADIAEIFLLLLSMCWIGDRLPLTSFFVIWWCWIVTIWKETGQNLSFTPEST